MRIAIVNDMSRAVEAMRRVIVAHGEHQVVWVARDGHAAVHQCERDRPDLLRVDLVKAAAEILALDKMPPRLVNVLPCGNS